MGEEAGFDGDDAAESPLGPGQLAKAGILKGAGGMEDVAKAVEQGVEFGGNLLGEDGVAAIGVDLFVGWRKCPFDSRGTCAGWAGARGIRYVVVGVEDRLRVGR